jgi:hypothetical protein
VVDSGQHDDHRLFDEQQERIVQWIG